jgi:transposase
MNEQDPQEITYRRQAFKLFEKGKSAAQILALIPRSRSWLFKWKQRFEREGWQALDSLPRTPRHSPQQCSPEAIKLVLRLRRRMEKSRVGLKSARAIRQEILRHRLLRPVPSLASIKRWLKDAGLTRRDAAIQAEAYYPVIRQPEEFFILSCDWLARYPQGAPKVFVFHTIDLQTHALAQTILLDKTAESADQHLRQAFAQIGLPDFLQLDNDSAFTGFGRTKPVFGRIIRLALYLGIELIFIPPGEPKRNHIVERVNGLWAESFWNRNHFRSHGDLLRRSGKFLAWYETYAPPALGGLTVGEATRQQRREKLRPRQVANIPEVLPLTAGRIHFLRRVDGRGEISILKEQWKVSKSLIGQYVWATLDLSRKELSIYHRRSLRAEPRLIKQHEYEIAEPIKPLMPEYKRRERKIEILKII